MAEIDRTRELLELTQTGDGSAMQELLVAYLPELAAFLRLQMGQRLQQRESSADIAQSVCREILTDMEDFEYRGPAAFKRWLFLTARRKLIDRARFHGRDRRDVGRDVALSETQLASGYGSFQTPSGVAMQKEEIERLEAAFDQMPEDYRDVIVYSKFLGMKGPEIGERMGKTANAVRVLLHRALARLGLLLDKDG